MKQGRVAAEVAVTLRPTANPGELSAPGFGIYRLPANVQRNVPLIAEDYAEDVGHVRGERSQRQTSTYLPRTLARAPGTRQRAIAGACCGACRSPRTAQLPPGVQVRLRARPNWERHLRNGSDEYVSTATPPRAAANGR